MAFEDDGAYLPHLSFYNELNNTEREVTIMRTITTDRLYLKPMVDGEWDKFIAHVFDADKVYVQFQGRLTRDMLEKPYTDCVICYTIMLPLTRDMIGYVELTPWTKNISYYIFEKYRHQGFAYEGVKAFMEACMRGEVTGRPEHKFYADVADYNIPGKRLLRKLGFREFGDDEAFLCYDPERGEDIQEIVA